ncbi:TAM domain methyltransferase [Halenospora varia]|nr:TAM domain methyltransferase [Halenospora varia]
MTSPPREVLAVDTESSEDDVTTVHEGVGDAGEAEKRGTLAVGDKEDDDEVEVPISATASVSSSLYESVEENGRTYHKYKEGKYFLPNDEQEQSRLDLQHHLCKLTLHGRLHLAPMKEKDLKTALDFGTGTGIWAIEFAEKFPNCQVIGSDLSPIQPEFIPANLSFEVDDIEDTWVYPHPFNYIHGRLMAYALHNPKAVFTKAFAALSPGGYLEMQDLVPPIQCIDDTIKGTMIETCAALMLEGSTKAGLDVTTPQRYKDMMEEIGFVDVKVVPFEWPIGTWPKSKYHKRIGAWFLKDMELGVEGIIMGLFTRVLGMKREKVSEMVVQLKAEMRDPKIHCYQPFSVVYGRKPE